MTKNTEIIYNSIRGEYAKIITYGKIVRMCSLFSCKVVQEENNEWQNIVLNENDLPIGHFREYRD